MSDPPAHKATADKRVMRSQATRMLLKGTLNAELRYSRKRDGCIAFEVSMHRKRLMMLAPIVLTSDDASVTIAAT